MARGQASSEYLVLLAAIMFLSLIVLYIMQYFISGISDVNVVESRNYWKGTSPLRIDDWSLRSAVPDANGNASVQIAMTITNPTNGRIVMRKILFTGMNFTQAYSRSSQYAGSPDDMTPITISPGETSTVVLIQISGPAAPKNYELWVSFDLIEGGVSRTQEGVVPLRGVTGFVSAEEASTPQSGGCLVGQVSCNYTGTKICCPAGQICSQGTMCCPAGRVACAGSCCQGSCSGGLCVPPGYFVCGGAPCQNGKNCCAGVCQVASCEYPDYMIKIFVNATFLGIGDKAEITVVTLNVGTLNATNSSTTRLEVGSDTYSYVIGALANGTNASNSTTYTCTGGKRGTYAVNGSADYGNVVYEWNYEANNINATVSLTCSNAKADLQVLDLYANATELSLGEKANITVSTNNTGGAATGGGSNTALSTNGSGSPLAPSGFAISNLPTGSSSRKYSVFTCSLTTFGLHNITATADSSAQIDEADETNNANSTLLIDCQAPDLVVPSLIATSYNLSLGEYALVFITTENAGTAAANASNTSINASGGSGNPLLDSSFAISALGTGGWQKKMTEFICNTTTVGIWNITAYADNTTDVAEINETNNLNSTQINCAAMDLAVGPLSSSSPNPIAGGAATNITVPMSNVGTPDLNGYWEVTPQVDITPSGPAVGGVPTVNVSQNGSQANTTFEVTCPDNLGIQATFTINASVPQVAGETNIANNWKTIQIVCQAGIIADLAVGPLTVVQQGITMGGMPTVGSGATVNISMPVFNAGPPKPGTWYFTPNLTATGGTLGSPPNMSVAKDGTQAFGIFQYTCPSNLLVNTTYQINASVAKMPDETITFNNYQTLDLVCLVAAPDLIVESMTPNPASPISISTSTDVEMAITNIGNANALPFQVNVTVSGGGILPMMMNPTIYNFPGLFSGMSNYQTFTYLCPPENGTYSINATIDPPANEINTANNELLINITCNPVNSPDIEIIAPLSASPAPPILALQSTTITVRARNAGTADTGLFGIDFVADSGTVSPATWIFANMVAGSPTYYKYLNYTCPASPGLYNVTASADNVTGEADTANNQLKISINCVLGPDIQISNLTPTNKSIYVNQSTPVAIPVKNIGPGPSQAFNLTVAVNGGSFTYTARQIPALSAYSGTVNGLISFTCPSTPGNYTINATAPQLYGENNIANNFNLTTVECKAGASHLVVVPSNYYQWAQFEECHSSTCNIPYGQSFTFYYNTKNIGQLPVSINTITRRLVLQEEPGSPDYTGPLYITSGESNGNEFAGYSNRFDISIPPLVPGAFQVQVETGNCPNELTHYGISGWPDYFNQTGQPFENWAIGHIWCMAPPDINIGTLYASGNTVYIPYENIGSMNTIGSFNITISASGGMTITGSPKTIASAHTGVPYETSVTYTCPGTPGTYTITATAENVNYETELANNVGTLDVVCP